MKQACIFQGLLTKQTLGRALALLACVVWISGSGSVAAAGPPAMPAAHVRGSAVLIWGTRMVPLAGARVELVKGLGGAALYDAITDQAGRYVIDATPGQYAMQLRWMGGDCAEIHRASFSLHDAEDLTFDFLVMQCPMTEPVHLKSSIGERAQGQGGARQADAMSVPLAEQRESYREQTIPAELNRWPEIVISFGRYDNTMEDTRYFSRHQLVMNPFAVPDPPVPLALPVIITVDRFTLRASSVRLNKQKMVFEATGEVSLSDGKHTRAARSARLLFSGGRPLIESQ